MSPAFVQPFLPYFTLFQAEISFFFTVVSGCKPTGTDTGIAVVLVVPGRLLGLLASGLNSRTSGSLSASTSSPLPPPPNLNPFLIACMATSLYRPHPHHSPACMCVTSHLIHLGLVGVWFGDWVINTAGIQSVKKRSSFPPSSNYYAKNVLAHQVCQ